MQRSIKGKGKEWGWRKNQKDETMGILSRADPNQRRKYSTLQVRQGHSASKGADNLDTELKTIERRSATKGTLSLAIPLGGEYVQALY